MLKRKSRKDIKLTRKKPTQKLFEYCLSIVSTFEQKQLQSHALSTLSDTQGLFWIIANDLYKLKMQKLEVCQVKSKEIEIMLL